MYKHTKQALESIREEENRNSRTSFPTFAAEESEISQQTPEKSIEKSPGEFLTSPKLASKTLERKHELLMNSISETQEALVSSNRKSQSSASPAPRIQADPSIGTFSQCYEPGQISDQARVSTTRTSDIKISYEDVLTDPRIKDIWRKYFRHDTNVNIDLFANCVADECREILPEDPEILERTLDLLKERVSLNGVHVSLNALQIFTKAGGLENALREIALEATEQHEAELAYQTRPKNEEILTEIEGVKKMLDEKHKALIKKDQALREKEIVLERQQERFLQRISEFAQTEFKRCENMLHKVTREKARRLEGLEQVIENKLATLKRKKQTAPESAAKMRQSVSFSQSEEGDRLKKQKARITSLEQLHKELKAKCDLLAGELDRERAKSAEYAKQCEKYKNILKIQEQKLQRQEMESSLVKIAETPKQRTKVSGQKENELEEQKAKPKVNTNVAVTEHVGSREMAKTYTSLLSNIIRGIRKSLPHYIAVYKEELGDEKAIFKVKIGELLYPSMNDIMPEIVDSVHLSQGIQPHENALTILEIAWETVNFAFETHIAKSKKQGVKGIQYKSTTLKKALESAKKESKFDKNQFPLYTLFSNHGVTRAFLKDIESICEPKKLLPVKLKEKPAKLTPNQIKLDILAALLLLLLTDSDKKAKQAVEKLKSVLNEKEAEMAGKEICGYRGVSAIAVASAIESISQDCVGIFLALAIDPVSKNELFRQLSSTECVLCLIAAFENSVEADNPGQQDDLIVLIHKLIVASGGCLDKGIVTRLRKVLQEVMKTVKGEDRRFFLSNVESLTAHLDSLE